MGEHFVHNHIAQHPVIAATGARRVRKGHNRRAAIRKAALGNAFNLRSERDAVDDSATGIHDAERLAVAGKFEVHVIRARRGIAIGHEPLEAARTDKRKGRQDILGTIVQVVRHAHPTQGHRLRVGIVDLEPIITGAGDRHPLVDLERCRISEDRCEIRGAERRQGKVPVGGTRRHAANAEVRGLQTKDNGVEQLPACLRTVEEIHGITRRAQPESRV